MQALFCPQLVDVPNSPKWDCKDVFWTLLNKAPDSIVAEVHSQGSHTGDGTTWAGGYVTYEIFDKLRPDWPTQAVEEIAQTIEWAIIENVNQQTQMKIR